MSKAEIKNGLTDDQDRAVKTRGSDLIVTAGAGSGKTRTLVARYLSLLEEGMSPSRIAAITFTRKAAREMRNRVRSELRERLERARDAETRRRWEKLELGIDAARIGTIHSLCSEILRAHPAEAGVDPAFGAIDEGISATLKIKAVEDGLSWAVGQPELRPLFDCFSARAMQGLGEFFLSRRLDAAPFLSGQNPGRTALRGALADFLKGQEVVECLASMHGLIEEGGLENDAGDKLAEQVFELLRCYDQALSALSRGELTSSAAHLFVARQKNMQKNVGRSQSLAKEALGELREIYDSCLGNWLGGGKKGDSPPDPDVEKVIERINPLLSALFQQVQSYYQVALSEQRALDYDDLEAGALRLLAMPGVAARWQGDLEAVLVDEFQDTNQRQRLIVQALCGDNPGRLFVVGDSRQSIYRFRGADVTVFRKMHSEIVRKGGDSIDLNFTFRTHEKLLRAMGDLLRPVMGDATDLQRPYLIPFSELKAQRTVPRDDIQAPYVEFILGVGEDAESGRSAAAQAFASCLLELQQSGQITTWEDVTLLFRSSSGFEHYENALEEQGIPFLTVAGSGFFERPEIRDLLNILHALADLWDDLAVAGVLRSPAFGLSDAALYNLRYRENKLQPLRLSLKGELDELDVSDRERAQRADRILSMLEPWVERLPIAELLQRAIEETDYRAVLASAPSRLWRNLDKLLADARNSGLVQVRAFMEYIEALRDVGAREGEAPADAEGAVRLMTIHKAKGLEFNIVVLADAARLPPRGSSAAYVLPETGFTYRPDKLDNVPLVHRLAAWYEKDQEDAERKRLLYVALTRAREKLLISGHITVKDRSCSANGWMGELCSAAGIDLDMALEKAGEWQTITLDSGELAGLWIETGQGGAAAQLHEQAQVWPESKEQPLFEHVASTRVVTIQEERDLLPQEDEDYARELSEDWRVIRAGEPPAVIVGSMVHRAIQRWHFPGDKGFEALMQKEALQAGLADAKQRSRALAEAAKLLIRFREHTLWQEINAATERYHELPFTRPGGQDEPIIDTGYIDVLYRNAEGYTLVEFKTDELGNALRRQEMVSQYLPQLSRYVAAVQQLLGIKPRGVLCFLDDRGKVTLEEG